MHPVSYAYGWAPGPHQLNPALEVAADAIAGRQTTGALLDWPPKALCPAQDWSCMIVQST